MFSAGFHRNAAPVAVFPRDEEDAVELRLIHNVQAVRNREKPHAAGGKTTRVRIIKPIAGSSEFEKSLGPVLERNFFVQEIRRQRSTGPSIYRTRTDIPETFLSWSGIQ